jgi:tripartite-type tricarboxylate transporter receptor subunit TctC
MLHVPYGGISGVITALLSDTIDIALVTPPTLKPHTDGGKVLAIAATSKERHALYPDTPTLEEAGFPGMIVVVWYGILAPAGTPEPVLAHLRNEIRDLLKDTKVTQRLDSLGYQVSYLEGETFKSFVLQDFDQWKSVAKAANIVVLE